MRRTTLSLPADALATVEAEARRRGVPITAVVAEAVAEKATAIRAARRRPRLGIVRSADGLSAADLTSEPVAEPPT